MKLRTLFTAAALAATTALAALPAQAQKSADTLRVMWRTMVTGGWPGSSAG